MESARVKAGVDGVRLTQEPDPLMQSQPPQGCTFQKLVSFCMIPPALRSSLMGIRLDARIEDHNALFAANADATQNL